MLFSTCQLSSQCALWASLPLLSLKSWYSFRFCPWLSSHLLADFNSVISFFSVCWWLPYLDPPHTSLPSPRPTQPAPYWPSHFQVACAPEAQHFQKLEASSTPCPPASLLLFYSSLRVSPHCHLFSESPITAPISHLKPFLPSPRCTGSRPPQPPPLPVTAACPPFLKPSFCNTSSIFPNV